MKKYTLTITDNKGFVEYSAENTGFNPLEIIGLLTWKQRDIIESVVKNVNPDVNKKIYVDENGVKHDLSTR
jgi:hypothetical protein